MSLSAPHLVQQRLEQIEQDLALRQNELEQAALDWYRAKRDREEKWASAFLIAEGTVADRKATADLQLATFGADEEAAYEACRAVCRVLDTRAAIGMALLKSQGRV